MGLSVKEKADLIEAITDLLAKCGTEPPTAVPWYRDTSSPVPTEKLTDLTNVAELKRYLAHGFRANLTRGVSESDWPVFLSKADGIFGATSPEAADAVVMNAGKFDQDTAIELTLGGGTQGGGFTQLVIYAPAPKDFSAAARWLIGVPDPNVGPSGQ